MIARFSLALLALVAISVNAFADSTKRQEVNGRYYLVLDLHCLACQKFYDEKYPLIVNNFKAQGKELNLVLALNNRQGHEELVYYSFSNQHQPWVLEALFKFAKNKNRFNKPDEVLYALNDHWDLFVKHDRNANWKTLLSTGYEQALGRAYASVADRIIKKVLKVNKTPVLVWRNSDTGTLYPFYNVDEFHLVIDKIQKLGGTYE